MSAEPTIQDVLTVVVSMRSELAELRSEMATKSDLAAVRSEMATKSDLAMVRAELRTVDAKADAIRAEVSAHRAETKASFAALDDELTRHAETHRKIEAELAKAKARGAAPRRPRARRA